MINLKLLNKTAKLFCTPERPGLNYIFFDGENIVFINPFCIMKFKQKEFKEKVYIAVPTEDIEGLEGEYDIYNGDNKIIFKNNNKEIKLKGRDLESMPDYNSFIKNDGLVEVGFSIEKLEKVIKVFKEAKKENIKLTIGTKNQGVIFKSECGEIESFLMPIKI